MTADTESAHHALNEALIAQLLRWRWVRSDAVEAAFRAVPRHRFLPEVTLERAYADDAITTKQAADGTPISIAFQPTIIAALLEQLDVQPGHRVLEIGAGTGYNAALLAELAGPAGEVTTIEYDAETAERARQALDATGHTRVHVIHGDGAVGCAERAPYDRLIVSAGAWDVPQPWLDQLLPDGRLVVPLLLPGWNLSIAFERDGDRWAALSSETCSFMPMQGAANVPPRDVPVGDLLDLRLADDREVDADALAAAFAQPRQEIWTGALLAGTNDRYDRMLVLAGALPGACRYTVHPGVVDQGRIEPLFLWGGPMICEGGSLAYITSRRTDEQPARWELGVFGHGPSGRRLAEYVAEQLRAWEHASEPRIELHPAGTLDERLDGAHVIDKHNTRIAFWIGAAALNEALIAQLRHWRSLRSDSVEAAIRAVPRHLFVPEVPLEEAYANDAVITKRHPDGSPQSSASAPAVVAGMLEQLDVQPGHRVLEIGAGTGYNAALLAKLGANVTTIEYDAETAERARHALAKAGVPDVLVVTGDGADGYPERAPYDRLIVTTGAWDVAPAWLRQLGPNGRLVVPLRFPGWNWSMAFDRAGDHWRSVSQHTCGFIPMEGSAGRPARWVRLTGGIRMAIEDDRELGTGTLERAFAQPRQEVWTGSSSAMQAPAPTTSCSSGWQAPLQASASSDPEATESGEITPLFTWGGPMVCDGDSLAYLTNRRAGRQLWELGVVGHGSAGQRLAGEVAEQARTWDRTHRETEPRVELHPAGTPDERLLGAYVIDKRDTRIAIFWR